MTKKEKLIQMICEKIRFDFEKETIEKIFEIINEYDWACFCSQMSDYDKPMERVEARDKLNEKMKEFPFYTACEIWNLIKGDNETSSFYSDNFHSMSKEYTEE